MINWEKTFEKYGYKKEDLVKSSTSPVLWECDDPNCQGPDVHRIREYKYVYANKKMNKAKRDNKIELCQTCAHKHRKGITPNKKKRDLKPLPPQINEVKTFEYFGYEAKDLPPWSKKRIILDCDCGEEKETSRCQLNNSVAIKETGNYKCTACWTKELRSNAKVSSETRTLMKESQSKRREREKTLHKDEYDRHMDEIRKLHAEFNKESR